MRSRTRLAVAVVAGSAALASVVGAGTAFADPSFTPSKTDIAGVGSNTTQGVMNAYATAYNATKPASRLASWDATPQPSNIVTKSGCAAIPRPNGSSAGITALLNDKTGCIDFARSSRKKKTDGTESSLAFFAFARDGVTWVHIPVTSGTAKTPTNLTDAQLKSIYTCSVTNWNKISSSLPSNTIKAYLPQAGSGTRAFFETAIGITDAQVGSCVNQTIEENTGTALAGSTTAVAPYSIADWIAQKNKKVSDVRGGTVLGEINGVMPLTASGTLNTSFPANHLRLVYNVVKTSGGVVSSKYTALFGSTGYLCKNQSIATSYGFASLGGACGSKS